MSDPATVRQILSPLLRRYRAGKAAMSFVGHPGEESPGETMTAVERALRDDGIQVIRFTMAELAPHPVKALIRFAETGTRFFSIVCDPKTLLADDRAVVKALNLHRDNFADAELCAVFWIPLWVYPAFAQRASNFLAYRIGVVELDLDGSALQGLEESPRFFVPPPPHESFFSEHEDDIERLADLLSRHDRVALVGDTYYGWPGGLGALIRATLHRYRDAFAAASGVFWIDGRSERWDEQFAELAPRMGENLYGTAEERIEAVVRYLRDRPKALVVCDNVRDPHLLRQRLGGDVSALSLGGRLLISTPRMDLSPREFPPPQIMTADGADSPPLYTLTQTLSEHGSSELSWSPDGRLLAVVKGGEIVLLTAGDWQTYRTLQGETGDVQSFDWSPDGRFLAASSRDGLEIRRTDDWTSERTIATQSSPRPIWSSDGRWLALVYTEEIQILSAHDWKCKASLESRVPHWQEHFPTWSPDGRLLAFAGSSGLEICDTENKKRKRLSEAAANCFAWSPDGRIVASSVGATVELWDQELSRLEGRLEAPDFVDVLSFSSDGRLLAGIIPCKDLRIWRCDTWEWYDLKQGSTDFYFDAGPKKNLTFHPQRPLLAAENANGGINIWSFGFGTTEALRKRSAHYTNAKVVLMGNTGAGKTALSLVLTGKPFRPTESTHGRHVHVFDRYNVDVDSRRSENREVLLWDLAGQPDYRLIHQLHLDEVTVALVVFDAASETDQFAGVRHWDRALRQSRRATGASGLPLTKILVAARTDTGRLPVDRKRVDALIKELDFDAYFETSAKYLWQIPELTEAVKKAVDWDNLPRVHSTRLFQEIKSFLLEEKLTGRLLATADELRRAFEKTGKGKDAEDLARQFEICVGLVSSRGLIRGLSFGSLVVLQPEILDGYASSMIHAARDEPGGLGFILEEDVLTARFRVPDDVRLESEGQEKLLLIATVEELLEHEIALREPSANGTLLVFPSQLNRDWPEAPGPEGQAVIFEFEGAILNLYTTLVVRLARSGLFALEEMWKDAARFKARVGGHCGLWLREIEEGRSSLSLFFTSEASEETRFQFEEYVDAHLTQRALLETLDRRRIFVCPQCSTPVSDLAARRRRQRGHDSIVCGVCETEVSLLDHEARLPAPVESKIAEMDRSADRGRDLDRASLVLRGKVETEDFDVFLAYNSDERAAVDRLAAELRKRGLYPWLDHEQIPPGRPFPEAVEAAVSRVRAAAVVIGAQGLGRWQTMELRSFLSRCVEAGLPLIPVLLPGLDEVPEELAFLRQLVFVSFSEDVEEGDVLDRLEWGITGRRPLGRFG